MKIYYEINNNLQIGGGKNNFDEELQSKVLDWLRFPMIVLVVYIHYWGENIPESSVIGSTIYDSIRIFMCHVISRAAVPTFFLISGYYFFYKIKDFTFDNYKDKLKKRIRTILIPYLLWNAIAISKIVILKIGAWVVKGKPLDNVLSFFEENGFINLFWSCNEWYARTNWFGHELIESGPILIPMWYLRDLMIFFILTPAIYWCLKRKKKLFLSVLFLLYVSGIRLQILGFSLSIIYFVIGCSMALNNQNIIKVFYSRRKLFYGIMLLLLPFMIFLDNKDTIVNDIIYPLFVFVLVPCYINITTSLMQQKIIKPMPELSKSSFFVYALHVMILGYCASIIKLIIPSDFWILASIRYLFTPLFCVSVCYVCYIILKRFVPNCLSTLIGGRL